MKRILIGLLAALTLWSAAGCAMARRAPEGETLGIYYAADPDSVLGGDILAAAQVDWSGQAELPPEEQGRLALELLLGGCRAEGFVSPLPRGTQLLNCRVDGGRAEVDFSAAYGQLSGMELSVADYCVTLTLTQIGGIYSVHILVNGQELAYRKNSVFLASDALLSSTDDVVRSFTARLYFTGPDGQLAGEDRLLTLYEGQTRAAVVMDALLSGPEDPELQPVLPEGFAVLGLRMENALCYLNLPSSDEALLPPDAAGQEQIVRSVVRSLCSLSGVSEVQILVDGELRTALGAVDISQPLGPNK